MSRLLLGALLLCSVALFACRGRADISATIQEIKRKHEHRLMDQPGVVSVGLGRDADGNPAIIVGMDARRAQEAAELPQALEGYPVITEIVGPIRAQ